MNGRPHTLRTSVAHGIAVLCAAVLLALSACGGGGDSSGTPPSDIGTLAYVVTQCSETGRKALFSEHQALHILHGARDVTVMETPGVGPVSTGVVGLCKGLTLLRNGELSILRDAFQGLAVSPDGAAVVFEITDDFSVDPKLPLGLAPDQKGIFSVRADGSGLRPLGPPSRLPFFYIEDNGGFIFFLVSFAFSPDSRMVTFADTGPDAAGHEAGQLMTLDVNSGERRQVTHLPPGIPPPNHSRAPSVRDPFFIDNQTIGFFTFANPDGLNPAGNLAPFTVSLIDGTLKAVPLPVALQGSQIDFTFAITGDKPAAIMLPVPGEPKNHIPGRTGIREVFAIDGSNEIQLTNFQREETGEVQIFDVDRQTVYFEASADPFGTNPSENCQIFSVDRLGGNLRQLTSFSEGPQATSGCDFSDEPLSGCTSLILNQDSRTRILVFYSSCDPFDTTNHSGAQVFAMHPDGSGLRQLTQTQGVATQPDGTVTRELPGPSAYGPYLP